MVFKFQTRRISILELTIQQNKRLSQNQHGLNEEKNLIGKQIISQLSASDVTGVVSLDTNNQA